MLKPGPFPDSLLLRPRPSQGMARVPASANVAPALQQTDVEMMNTNVQQQAEELQDQETYAVTYRRLSVPGMRYQGRLGRRPRARGGCIMGGRGRYQFATTGLPNQEDLLRRYIKHQKGIKGNVDDMLQISSQVYVDRGLVVLRTKNWACRSTVKHSNAIVYVGGAQFSALHRIGLEEYSWHYQVWLANCIAAQKSKDSTLKHQTVEEATSSIVEFAQNLHSLGKQTIKHAYQRAFDQMSWETTDGAPKGVAISADKEQVYCYPIRLRLAVQGPWCRFIDEHSVPAFEADLLLVHVLHLLKGYKDLQVCAFGSPMQAYWTNFEHIAGQYKEAIEIAAQSERPSRAGMVWALLACNIKALTPLVITGNIVGGVVHGSTIHQSDKNKSIQDIDNVQDLVSSKFGLTLAHQYYAILWAYAYLAIHMSTIQRAQDTCLPALWQMIQAIVHPIDATLTFLPAIYAWVEKHAHKDLMIYQTNRMVQRGDVIDVNEWHMVAAIMDDACRQRKNDGDNSSLPTILSIARITQRI